MYRVDVVEAARAAIAELPAGVLGELADAFAVLEIAPWGGAPQHKNNPGGAVRRVLFGPGGSGQLVYVILEDVREVHVVLIVWLGH